MFNGKNNASEKDKTISNDIAGNSISSNTQDVEELLQKYDKEEGNKRKLTDRKSVV